MADGGDVLDVVVKESQDCTSGPECCTPGSSAEQLSTCSDQSSAQVNEEVLVQKTMEDELLESVIDSTVENMADIKLSDNTADKSKPADNTVVDIKPADNTTHNSVSDKVVTDDRVAATVDIKAADNAEVASKPTNNIADVSLAEVVVNDDNLAAVADSETTAKVSSAGEILGSSSPVVGEKASIATDINDLTDCNKDSASEVLNNSADHDAIQQPDEEDFDRSVSDNEYSEGSEGSGSESGSEESGSMSEYSSEGEEYYSEEVERDEEIKGEREVEGEIKRERGKPGLGERRHSGDGEEQPEGVAAASDVGGEGDAPPQESKRAETEEDRQNPAYVPRKSSYFEHDMRGAEDDGSEAQESKSNDEKKGKRLWKDESRWLHDRYNEREMAPKSREEIIATYGYDIREYGPDEPVRGGGARGRARGGRGGRGNRGNRRLGDYISEEWPQVASGRRDDVNRSYSDGEEEVRGERGGYSQNRYSEPRQREPELRNPARDHRGGSNPSARRSSEREYANRDSGSVSAKRGSNRGFEERSGSKNRYEGENRYDSNQQNRNSGFDDRNHVVARRNNDREYDSRGGGNSVARNRGFDDNEGEGYHRAPPSSSRGERRGFDRGQHGPRTIQNSQHRYNRADEQADRERYAETDIQQHGERVRQTDRDRQPYSDRQKHRERGRRGGTERAVIVTTERRSQDVRYDGVEVNPRSEVNAKSEGNRSGSENVERVGWGGWRNQESQGRSQAGGQGQEGQGHGQTGEGGERRSTVIVQGGAGAPEILPPVTRALTSRPTDRPVVSSTGSEPAGSRDQFTATRVIESSREFRGWAGGDFTPGWQPQEGAVSEQTGGGSKSSKRYSSQRQGRGGETAGEERGVRGSGPSLGTISDERGVRGSGPPLVQHVRPQAAPPQSSNLRSPQQQQQQTMSNPAPQYYDASPHAAVAMTNFPPPPMLPYTLPPTTLSYPPRPINNMHPSMAHPPQIRVYGGAPGVSNPPPGLMAPPGVIQGHPYLPAPPQHYISTGHPMPPPTHQMMYTAPPGYPLPPGADPSNLAPVSEPLQMPQGSEGHLYYSQLPPHQRSAPPPPPGLHGTTYYGPPTSSVGAQAPYPMQNVEPIGAQAPHYPPPNIEPTPRRVKAAIPIINPQDLGGEMQAMGAEGGMMVQPQSGRQLRGTYTAEPAQPLTYSYVPAQQPAQQQYKE